MKDTEKEKFILALGFCYWISGIYLLMVETTYNALRSTELDWLETYFIVFKLAMITRGITYCVAPLAVSGRKKYIQENKKVKIISDAIYILTIFPLEVSALPGLLVLLKSHHEKEIQIISFIRKSNLICLLAFSVNCFLILWRYMNAYTDCCKQTGNDDLIDGVYSLVSKDKHQTDLAIHENLYYREADPNTLNTKQRKGKGPKSKSFLLQQEKSAHFLEDSKRKSRQLEAVLDEPKISKKFRKPKLSEMSPKRKHSCLKLSLKNARKLTPEVFEKYLEKNKELHLTHLFTSHDIETVKELFLCRLKDKSDLGSESGFLCGACQEVIDDSEESVIHPNCSHVFHWRCFEHQMTTYNIERTQVTCPNMGCQEPTRELMLREMNMRFYNHDISVSVGSTVYVLK